MKLRPNLALYVPLAAAGLAVTALLVLAAHEHGKRQERRRAWLIDRSRS
jgi:hypothetical protein